MRIGNGAPRSMGTLSSASDRAREKRRIGRGVVRGLVASLVVGAVGLSALAVWLTARLGEAQPAKARVESPAEAARGEATKDERASGAGRGGGGGGGAGRAKGAGGGGGRGSPGGAAEMGRVEVVRESKSARPEGGGGASRAAAEVPSAKPHPARRPYPDGPKSDPKYARDRVYCMVPFVWNVEFYEVIMQTWGKRCDVINFITDSIVAAGGARVGGDQVWGADDPKDATEKYKYHSEFPEGTFPENVRFINMTRPWTGCKDSKTGKPKVCRHIWEKMWRSWIYVKDHHLDQAEWFCKVDYDTYFFPENLQYWVRDVKNWDPYAEHHYFGLELSHRVKLGFPSLAAGAAACWSHKTMEGIAEVYRQMPKGYTGMDRGRCEDRPQASEEISTSMCLLKGLNVTLEPMRDDKGREYVMVDPYSNHLGWNRTEQGEWWYWQGKPKGIAEMEDCCAHRPMGIHKYKLRKLIEELDQQLYGPAGNKELKRLKARDRRYVDKVRRAMGLSP